MSAKLYVTQVSLGLSTSWFVIAIGRQEEVMYLTTSNRLIEKQAINITYILPQKGKKYLLVARDNISSQVEARVVLNKEAYTITLFIQEDIICRHRIFQRMLINSSSKFKKEVIKLLNKQRIDRIQVSTYYTQVNRMIKRGYQPLKDTLSKLGANQVSNLLAVLFVD